MTSTALSTARCLDCGKCTGVCPVARYNHALSPRRLMRRLAEGRNVPATEAVWDCLTCGRCDARCPQEVPISRSVPALRTAARERGEGPASTRCSAMAAVAGLQARTDVPQQRLGWLEGSGLTTDPQSKTLLWTGCAPYFDAFYADNGVATLDAVKGAIAILNALGIAPAVRGEERCCGHDQLWGGEVATFAHLAARNVEMFRLLEPELIVTVCPECQLTLEGDYRERFGQPACRVAHIAELVAERAEELELAPAERTVAYNDPCRLGRHQGKYEEPRAALRAVPGLQVAELPRNKAGAVCCAGNWQACNQASKRIQTDLLKSAAATGSGMLVTACPKCLIHLKCAQSGGEGLVPDIEIRDLATVVARALQNTGTSKRNKGGEP